MKTFLKHAPKGPSLRELYTCPMSYGSDPCRLQWSPEGDLVAFLWNEKGGFCKDLYVCEPGGVPVKLTDAASIKALPVEDDSRDPADVAYAEQMYGGISDFAWAPESPDLVFLCRGNLFLCNLDGECERLNLTSQSLSGLSAPLSGGEVFFQKGANLFSYSLDHGVTRQLTFLSRENVFIEDYCASGDGSCIAVKVLDTRPWEEVLMPDYTPAKDVKINRLRRNNVGTPLAKYRVGVVDTRKEAAPLEFLTLPSFDEKLCREGLEAYPSDLCWSPDGESLYFAMLEKDYCTYRLYEARRDAKGAWKATERYTEHTEPWIEQPWLGCDGEGAVYFLSFCDGFQQLYRLARRAKKPVRVTPGGSDVIRFQVALDGRVTYADLNPDPRKSVVYTIAPGERKPRALKACPGRDWESFAASRDGSHLAVLGSGIMKPAVLSLGGPEGKFAQVLDCEQPLLKKWPRARVEEFSFRNREDGAEICGTLTFPAKFDPAKRHPVVLRCVYAGQGKMGFNRYNLLDNYMANEMGYVLVGIDLRASYGYGRDFARGYYKSLGIIDTGELVSCAEYLKAQPWADPERIGIWGGSYGGFLTLMAMCNHPGVFHTGVSWKPVTDWKNYWDCYTAPRLRRPQDDPEIYRRTSPVYHAAGLEGNLLIVHGMQDDNVLFQDAAWMIQQLIEKQKYFDLMIYPRDNHGLSLRYESLPDCMERIAAYFEEHMGLGPLE